MSISPEILQTTYPVAEVFHSIQGEGQWAGAQMLFLRLAGCSVGRYSTDGGFGDLNWSDKDFKLYRDKQHSLCTSFDGQKFLCDTDYHNHGSWTLEALAEECWEDHLCVTGGEPLLHNLMPLAEICQYYRINLHLETSGTILIPANLHLQGWITCSPKQGFLPENYPRVDEWKFLITPTTDPESIKEFLKGSLRDTPVFFQPVQNISEPSKEACLRVMQFMKSFPQARLSVQLHKWLELR